MAVGDGGSGGGDNGGASARKVELLVIKVSCLSRKVSKVYDNTSERGIESKLVCMKRRKKPW